jgi:hypothetical protein
VRVSVVTVGESEESQPAVAGRSHETAIRPDSHLGDVTQPSTQTDSCVDADRRRRLRGTFVAVLVGTPWLLFLEPTRRIVSLELTLLAVVSGAGLGSVVALAAADFEGPVVSDATQAVVVLGGIVVGTTAVWLVIPSRLLGTFVQFALAFTWAVPAVGLLVHRSRRVESA